MNAPHGPSLLIADHAPTRAGIRMAIEDVASDCTEAGNAEDAIRAAEQAQPDVAIVGMEISGGGIPAVQGILKVAKDARVIVVTPSPDVEDLLDSLRAGAVGYLPGNINSAALRRIVPAVASGEAAVPRAMVLELARELLLTASGADGLTTREAQVLAMLRRGDSTAAIADRLSISPITVRRHISMLMHKTGASSRAALVEADIHLPMAGSAGWREPFVASG